MVFIILYVNMQNRSNHRALPTKTNSWHGTALAAGKKRGSRDISLPRFVSAGEAGRGEVFQLNADYIALSRYWKYIDSQASSPSCLLGSAPSTPSHNRPGTSWIFLLPGSSKLRSTTTRRYLDVSRTHGAKRSRGGTTPCSGRFFSF